MGRISAYLRSLIERQVNERKLVVWFDPGGYYQTFAATLTLPQMTIARYDGSFFALRYAVSSLLDGAEPPRLVVYVPQDKDKTFDALVELTSCGATLEPGAASHICNTRPSVVVKAALKNILGPEELRKIGQQVDEGRLSFGELDRDRDTGQGVLGAIFALGDPQEITLRFLADDRFDGKITEKDARSELAELFAKAYGITLPKSGALANWRTRVADWALHADFLTSLRPPIPRQFASLQTAPEGPQREGCVRLARDWRARRDVNESYETHADRVEQQLRLAQTTFTLAQIAECETFRAVEELLQTAIEKALAESDAKDTEAALHLAAQRATGYWSARSPHIQARWTLIQSAGGLLAKAREIEQALKEPRLTATKLFQNYTDGEHPWCELDGLQRKTEQQYLAFDAHSQRHASLVMLVERARKRYLDAGSTLAERFIRALQAEQFRLSSIHLQREIYPRWVAPALREGKTAYILVDALRFEIARELALSVSADYTVEMAATFGVLPSITPIGMAALLPGAVNERVVQVNTGIAPALEGVVLKDRAARMEWLKQHAGIGPTGEVARVVETTLKDLLHLRSQQESALKSSDLICVTSQEIDEVSETDNVLLARAALDGILTHLKRAIRRLTELGCKTIIFAADHGFLFAQELGSDMKLHSPGGETLDLHRRVWVGRGGEANRSFVRIPLAAFRLSDDPTLEIAVPLGFGGFLTAGGALTYFHGGLSLQECAVPVVTLIPTLGPAAGAASDIAWDLTLGSKTISTRFCSVRVSGILTGLFPTTAPVVRVEIQREGEILSRPVAASYGFSDATGDVQMQSEASESADAPRLAENTITLAIQQESISPGPVSIHLLDAMTGRTLKHLDNIPLEISI
jgi:hypothetical protein